MREAAQRVRDVMRADPRLIDPHLNWGEKMPSLRLEVDQARARALGLTPQDIARDAADPGRRSDGDDAAGRRGAGRRRRPRHSQRARRARPDRGSDDRHARRGRRAGRPGRARHPHDRGADHLAQGSRSRRHGARPTSSTACSRRTSRGRLWPKLASIRDSLPPGAPHRDGRRDRGIPEGQRARSSSSSRS